MMSLIFIVLLIAVVLAWKGERQKALYGFGLSLLLSIFSFIHHISSHLDLSL